MDKGSKSFARLLVLLQVILGCWQLVAVAQVERKGGVASCHLRELELCSLGAASMFQNPNGIPTSASEFKRQCEYLQESKQCLEDYHENCMTNTQASLVDMLGGHFYDIGEEFCKNGTRINTIYMKHAACLRGVQKKHQRTCLANLQVGFEPIHKIAHELRLRTACCNLNNLSDCILPQIEQSCGNEALEFVEELLKRAMGRTFQVTCRGFEPASARCNGLLPEPNQKPYNGRNTSAISRTISAYANAQTM